MRAHRFSLNRIARALPGLILLGLLAWGMFAGAKWLLGVITTAESTVSAAFIAASIAVVGSVISLAVGKAYETRASIRNDLRQKKTPVYEDIVHTLLYEIMFSQMRGQEPPSQQDIIESFARITEKLTIWGSDEVLLAFGQFKVNASGGDDQNQGMFMLEDLLLAIRKDLGHRNSGVRQKAILRLFVTDIDTVPPPARRAAAAD